MVGTSKTRCKPAKSHSLKSYSLSPSEQWKLFFAKNRKKRKKKKSAASTKQTPNGYCSTGRKISVEISAESTEFLLPHQGEMSENWEEFKAAEDKHERNALKPYLEIFGLKNY